LAGDEVKQKIVAWVSTSIRVNEPEVKAALERLAVTVESVAVGSPTKIIPGDDTTMDTTNPVATTHVFDPDPSMDDELCRQCSQPEEHANHG
jgi:hypothetical protein